jgi:hypothetical protein
MGSPGLLRRKKRGSQRRGNCATTPLMIKIKILNSFIDLGGAVFKKVA